MLFIKQGNQILGNVSPDEYSRIVKVLEDAILSTDLAVYFRYAMQIIENFQVSFVEGRPIKFGYFVIQKTWSIFQLGEI